MYYKTELNVPGGIRVIQYIFIQISVSSYRMSGLFMLTNWNFKIIIACYLISDLTAETYRHYLVGDLHFFFVYPFPWPPSSYSFYPCLILSENGKKNNNI